MSKPSKLRVKNVCLGNIFQKIYNIPGDELNGYFLARWKALDHIFQKIYNIPWSTNTL